MTKRGWWVVLAMLPLSGWAQASGAGLPVVKVGDVATYVVNLRADKRTLDEEVTIIAVDASQITSRVVRPARTAEGISTSEWGIVSTAMSATRFDPPMRTLKFPLTVGESWPSKYLSTGANQSQARGDMEFTVAAAERLSTPAGEFDTFRIESKGWVTGITWQGAVQVKQTLWYAPSISRFVKTEFQDWRGGRLWTDTVTELKSFKPAP